MLEDDSKKEQELIMKKLRKKAKRKFEETKENGANQKRKTDEFVKKLKEQEQ